MLQIIKSKENGGAIFAHPRQWSCDTALQSFMQRPLGCMQIGMPIPFPLLFPNIFQPDLIVSEDRQSLLLLFETFQSDFAHLISWSSKAASSK